jgi:hypothetical protein
MGPFEVLGVARNADETTIKRAYAKALKANRPEDDPVAFQAVNEAYQAALQLARQRQARMHATNADDEVAVMEREPSPPIQPVATHAPPETPEPAERPAPVAVPVATEVDAGPAFDYASFVHQLHELCDKDSPRKLELWLNSVAALYHIDRKAAVGDALLRQWLQAATTKPLPVGHARVLSGFFDRDFHRVLAIAEHSRAQEEVEDAIARERMHTMGENDSGRKVLRQLKRRPFKRWRAMLAMIDAGFAVRAVRLARHLAQRNGGALPASINPEQVQFMEMLANPYYEGRWRWLSLLLRSGVIAGCMGGAILGLLAGFFHLLGEDMPGGASLVVGIMLAVVLAVLWIREGLGWLRLHEDDKSTRAGPVSRWLPVALSVVAIVIALIPVLPAFVGYLMVGLATAAVIRSRFTFGEIAAMSVAFGMMLAPRLAQDVAGERLLLMLPALALVVRRCSEIAIARHRGVTLALGGDNRITAGIAAAIFLAAVLMLPDNA